MPRWFPWLALPLVAACGYIRKDTAKVIDPILTGQGTAYERKGTLGGFTLGPYAIRKTKMRREPVSGVEPITPGGLTRPGERILLTAELSAPKRGMTWTATCEGLRKATLEDEYAAVLDEARDAVRITCEVADGRGTTWDFQAEGLLSGNFGGTVTPRDRSMASGKLDVEILLYRRRFDAVKRHLHEPVAQVKKGTNAVAAMILAEPELAFVDPKASPELTEVSLTVLAALDLMPLGLEG